MAENEAIPGAALPAEAVSVAPPRIALRPHDSLPWLLLPQGIPLEILIEAAAVQVPNTEPWFIGVVSQRGNLLPVFDLARWSGLPVEKHGKQQIVVVNLRDRVCALLTETTPALLQINAPAPHVSPSIPQLAPFLHKRYTTSQGEAFEFDIEQWLTTASQHISRSVAVASH